MKTAPTSISHDSLQVQRKLVWMFTTYLLPAEVQMFSVMKCLQPTRISVEHANGYYEFVTDGLFAPSHRRPGVGARQWSRVFFGAQHSWCSLILDASFEFARASYSVSGEPWSTVHVEQRAFGGILCLLRSDRSLRWLDVCICTDASEKQNS